ncbi:hypothetical protein MA16_Dca013388 [Dendrobium catenatum]|uniref:Uncharacterized protein n=1 Tax=Dendrobium catenatum TaxID=906689 RepID=A0A2I0VL37_9ASPA|nr:hypothetical protein MA16_Dca013388 [Dendrobium catenatum]
MAPNIHRAASSAGGQTLGRRAIPTPFISTHPILSSSPLAFGDDAVLNKLDGKVCFFFKPLIINEGGLFNLKKPMEVIGKGKNINLDNSIIFKKMDSPTESFAMVKGAIDFQNMDEKMLAITTNQNIFSSSYITHCALNKNLPDMDFMMLNYNFSNNVPTQSIINSQKDGQIFMVEGNIGSDLSSKTNVEDGCIFEEGEWQHKVRQVGMTNDSKFPLKLSLS